MLGMVWIFRRLFILERIGCYMNSEVQRGWAVTDATAEKRIELTDHGRGTPGPLTRQELKLACYRSVSGQCPSRIVVSYAQRGSYIYILLRSLFRGAHQVVWGRVEACSMNIDAVPVEDRQEGECGRITHQGHCE